MWDIHACEERISLARPKARASKWPTTSSSKTLTSVCSCTLDPQLSLRIVSKIYYKIWNYGPNVWSEITLKWHFFSTRKILFGVIAGKIWSQKFWNQRQDVLCVDNYNGIFGWTFGSNPVMHDIDNKKVNWFNYS